MLVYLLVCCCRNGAAPLLEVELELLTPDMVWKPELAGSQKGSLQALVQRWLMSFLEVRFRCYSAGWCMKAPAGMLRLWISCGDAGYTWC